MFKKTTAFIILSTLALTACSVGAQSETERAGAAMAEVACLLFDENTQLEDVPEASEAIMQKYNFEADGSDMEEFLNEIQGTETLNELSVALRDSLNEFCPSSLEDNDIDAAELAETLILQ